MANKYKCDICKQMINNSHTTKKHNICGRCLRLKKEQYAYLADKNGNIIPMEDEKNG